MTPAQIKEQALQLPPAVQTAFELRDLPKEQVKSAIGEVFVGEEVGRLLTNAPAVTNLTKLESILSSDKFPISDLFVGSSPTWDEWERILDSWNGKFKQRAKVVKLLNKWAEQLVPREHKEPEALGSFLTVAILQKVPLAEWKLSNKAWVKLYRLSPEPCKEWFQQNVDILAKWAEFMQSGDAQETFKFEDIKDLVDAKALDRYFRKIFDGTLQGEFWDGERAYICGNISYGTREIFEGLVAAGAIKPQDLLRYNKDYTFHDTFVNELALIPEFVPLLLRNRTTFSTTIRIAKPAVETITVPQSSYGFEVQEMLTTLVINYPKQWEKYIGTWLNSLKGVRDDRNLLPILWDVLLSKQIGLDMRCKLLHEEWDKFNKSIRLKFLTANLAAYTGKFVTHHDYERILSDELLIPITCLKQVSSSDLHKDWFALFVRLTAPTELEQLQVLMHLAYFGWDVSSILPDESYIKYNPVFKALLSAGR